MLSMISPSFVLTALLALSVNVHARPSTRRATCPGGQTTSNDACCVWFDVLPAVQKMLDNECGEEAHESIRLTFHDAIGFSPAKTQSGQFGGGGADGSIIAFIDTEIKDDANDGIDEIVGIQKGVADTFPQVSYGDFIQFSGAVALTNCKAGPRLKFFAGRPNATAAAPSGLVPKPEQDVDTILARFADAGFSPEEVVALLASHSVAAQDTIEPDIHGSPFDSTPDTFDAQFFVETLLNGTLFPNGGVNKDGGDKEVESPIAGELRLQSDFALARDPRTSCEWQSFITDHSAMITKFQNAMLKMSILGHDQNDLIDCSDVIPVPAAFDLPDASFPPSLGADDVQAACSATPFPTLSTQPGAATSIAPVPDS